jgi:hypothetical protein
MLDIRNFTRLHRTILVILFMFAIPAANAQWTTIGSAGVVDEADIGIVSFGSPVPAAVQHRTLAVGTITLTSRVFARQNIDTRITPITTRRPISRGRFLHLLRPTLLASGAT